MEFWTIARCDEIAKGRCQLRDESPRFHDTISSQAHFYPIPVTGRRRRAGPFVSGFCRLRWDHRGALYDLVTAAGHAGNARVGETDLMCVGEALEQNTELDLAAVSSLEGVRVVDNRPAASAAARNAARRPNRSLCSIFPRLPT